MRLWLERIGVRPKRSFGVNKLDVEVAAHLARTGGIFVEAGANDGLAQSNTAYLEYYFGWRGLLIEPIPELARQCREKRPRALVEQCALVPFGFPDATISMTYCNLMSLVRGARGAREDDEAHVTAGLQYLRSGERPYAVKVPARTLTSVLGAHHISRCDLLSLDVEGYEAQVLRGLDFDRHAPRYILVEANNPAGIDSALGGRYDLVAHLSHHDRLYRLRGTEP